MGTPLPEIRVAVRTGDTPQRDRQAMTRRPPHILITTPESLYILLTSESGRRGLRGARTLIVDEVHAIVGNKRGSHLSLSMERLRALADGPVTRIGLSATQRPIEEVARFLVGADDDEADGSEDPRGDAAAPCGDAPLADAAESLRGGAPPAQIVDVGHARDMDLALEMSDDELGPIASQSLSPPTGPPWCSSTHAGWRRGSHTSSRCALARRRWSLTTAASPGSAALLPSDA